MFSQPAIIIQNRSQIQVSAGGQSPRLEQGVYDVWAAADTHIKVAETATDVSSSNGYLIPAGSIISIRITQDGMRVGSTGALSIHRVE
jgi:hypothetical protein